MMIKKITLVLFVLMGVSSCANPQIKHHEYRQSPCSCTTLKWRLEDVA